MDWIPLLLLGLMLEVWALGRLLGRLTQLVADVRDVLRYIAPDVHELQRMSPWMDIEKIHRDVEELRAHFVGKS